MNQSIEYDGLTDAAALLLEESNQIDRVLAKFKERYNQAAFDLASQAIEDASGFVPFAFPSDLVKAALELCGHGVYEGATVNLLAPLIKYGVHIAPVLGWLALFS